MNNDVILCLAEPTSITLLVYIGNITDFPADMLGSGSAEMHCHTGFGPVNSSLCQPLCSEWKQYSSLHTVMVLSFEAMSATIGLTTGIVSIVITLLFYRDS